MWEKDDIKVTLNNGVLSVTAETHKEESEEKEGKVIRRERHVGRYSRSMSVGRDIDPASIKASFENGVCCHWTCQSWNSSHRKAPIIRIE